MNGTNNASRDAVAKMIPKARTYKFVFALINNEHMITIFIGNPSKAGIK